MSGGRYHRYLLGELPEAERDLLEDEYFSTEEGFQELQAAEDELVDAYVAGELPPDRRARFEERYLRTDDDRQRVQYARLLQDAAARARGREAAPGRASSGIRPLAWAAALGAVALAGTLLFQMAQLRGEVREARAAREAAERSAAAQQQQVQERERRLGEVQRELDRLRADAERLTDLAGSVREGARVVTLVLKAGLRRDLEPVPQRRLSPDVTVVRLTLPLEAEVGRAYRASVQTAEGREVWARAALRPTRAEGGLALILAVPAGRLAAGHHLVVISGDDGVPLAEYVFQVVRP